MRLVQASQRDDLSVGKNGAFATLSEALRAARPGNTILVDAGVYLDECVTVEMPVRIIGVNGTPVFQATRLLPNEKAIFLTRADVTIENIAFRDAAGINGNGAGIRHERGNLFIENCIFRANQNGVFCADDPEATVTVSACEFIGNGSGDGHTHGLYVATEAASLLIERSTFVGTQVGHHVKSRARHSTVRGSHFGDYSSGRTSYAIDVPNGGIALISGNRLIQNPCAQHFAMINYGGEGMKYGANSLSVVGNAFEGSGAWLTVAVRNRSNVSPQIVDNQFGSIRFPLLGRGRVNGRRRLAPV
jgi:hypothetical protein